MTPADRNAIIDRINELDEITGEVRTVLNKHAKHEADMAAIAPDGNYENQRLTEAKESLMELSSKLTNATDALQQALTALTS